MNPIKDFAEKLPFNSAISVMFETLEKEEMTENVDHTDFLLVDDHSIRKVTHIMIRFFSPIVLYPEAALFVSAYNSLIGVVYISYALVIEKDENEARAALKTGCIRLLIVIYEIALRKIVLKPETGLPFCLLFAIRPSIFITINGMIFKKDDEKCLIYRMGDRIARMILPPKISDSALIARSAKPV